MVPKKKSWTKLTEEFTATVIDLKDQLKNQLIT